VTILVEQQSVCDGKSVEKCYEAVVFLGNRLAALEAKVKAMLRYTAVLEKQSFEI
jgi:hypothetical protein